MAQTKGYAALQVGAALEPFHCDRRAVGLKSFETLRLAFVTSVSKIFGELPLS